MEEKLKELLLQRKRKVIFDNHLKRSAVLIPFFIKDGEYHILFIKRSQEVENHKGEISFPGGLCEKGDEGPEETALRESFEETGIHPQDVRLLGTLDDMKTISTNYRVTPIVGVIPYPYSFTLQKAEVDEIITIPLNHLFDEENGGEEPVTRDGKTYRGYVYHYNQDLIWGATARILKNLLDIMINLKDTCSSQSQPQSDLDC
ncbi:MAG: CoA pyrophosphatase [Thermodesulfobacteriota bacterium]